MRFIGYKTFLRASRRARGVQSVECCLSEALCVFCLLVWKQEGKLLAASCWLLLVIAGCLGSFWFCCISKEGHLFSSVVAPAPQLPPPCNCR